MRSKENKRGMEKWSQIYHYHHLDMKYFGTKLDIHYLKNYNKYTYNNKVGAECQKSHLCGFIFVFNID